MTVISFFKLLDTMISTWLAFASILAEIVSWVNLSPFYKGVTVAEYQVIVVELFTCVPIKSPPAAVIIR